MSNKIASLYAELSADSSKLKTGLADAKRDLGGVADSARGATQSIGSQFSALTTKLAQMGVFVAIEEGLRQVISLAAESQLVDAKLAAVVKATGQAAGYTAEQIGDMSVAWMRQTGIDDEVIKSASTVMLTFREIGREVFPQAMEAAMNMSAVMGQDLQASVIQIGKALQEPIEGATALRRVGVQLTDQQQDMIKTFMDAGDKMSAQKIILQELQLEFGGAAKAAGETFTGSLNKLKGEFNNLAEEIGGHLLPTLTEATKAMTLMLSWDDRVRAAIKEHAGVVAKTAKTYDEYIAEMNRAAKEGGYAIDINGDLIKTYRMHGEEVEIVIQKKYALSKAEFELAQNTNKYNGMIGTQDDIMPKLTAKIQEQTDAQKKQNAEYVKSNDALNLKIMLQGELTKQNERYNEQMLTLNQRLKGYKDRIEELRGKPWLTEAQKKELKELEGSVDDVENAIKNLAIEHDRQTKQWLLNILQQKLAMKGLADEGMGMILDLGRSWGIVGDTEYYALKGIDEILNSTDTLLEKQDKLKKYIQGFNGMYSFAKIHILTIEETMYITSYGEGYRGNVTDLAKSGRNGRIAVATGGVIGAADGASFVVPPGYPGDSYLLAASSGERVEVTPEGDRGKKTKDRAVTMTFNVNTSLDVQQMARQIARELQRA